MVWSNISWGIRKNRKKILKNFGPKMSVEKFTTREGMNFSTDILGPSSIKNQKMPLFAQKIA